MHDSYNSEKFWKAYSRFWFASPSNERLRETSQKLSRLLVGDQPINVLCLGIGIGTMEFPLLKAIQDCTGRVVDIVGIDGSEGALNVASYLWSEQCDWNSLSTTADSENHDALSKIISSEFSKQLKSNNFLCFDFDQCFLDLELASAGNIPELPWCAAPKLKSVLHNGGFDIVTASTCLHHLTWWKSTLLHSLSLMKGNGILLLSQVSGDIRFVDADPSYLQNDHGDITVFGKLLNQFWKATGNTQVKSQTRSGAIDPAQITGLLDRLPLKRERFITTENTRQFDGLRYTVEGRLSLENLRAIFETCGYSPLRRAKAEIGEQKYQEAVDSTLNTVSTKSFEMKNSISWSMYRSESKLDVDNSILTRKFCSLSSLRKLTVDNYFTLFEYERSESHFVAKTSFNSPEITKTDFYDALTLLLTSGVLPSSCVAGMVGRTLVLNENLRNAIVFENPYNRIPNQDNKMARGLLEYSAFWSKQGYSNTNHLLAKLIPKLNRPIVLIVNRTKSCVPFIKADTLSHPTHLELRFSVPELSEDVRQAIKCTSWYEALIETASDGIKGMPRPFIFDVKEWSSAAEDVDFGSVLALNGIDVHAQVDQLKSMLHGNDEFPTAAESLLTTKLVETLFFIALTDGWTHCAFYPITFLDSKTSSCEALDAFIVFYDLPSDDQPKEPLDHRFFFLHEFEKYSTVFDQLGMRRLASIAVDQGISHTFGAFSHEVSKFSSFLDSGLFQEVGMVFDLPNRRNLTAVPTAQWKTPAGSINSLCNDLGSVIDKWRVCPIPEVMNWATDFLFLWAGTSARIQKFAGTESNTLYDLFDDARQIAINSHLVSNAKASDWHLDDVVKFKLFKAKWLSELSPIDLSGVPKDRYFTTDDKEMIGTVLRILVATFANALKNTKNTKDNTLGSIKVSVQVDQDDRMIIHVANDSDGQSNDSLPRSDGTLAVLRNCLNRFANFDSQLCFMQVGDKWVTSFALPVSVSTKRSDS